MKRIFTSDCEGPISKNDNAYEITAYYIPNGGKLFTVISRYDDVLADIVKREGYKAGDTLKLILPFLKAYGVTDKMMQDFSAKSLILIPNSKETLAYIKKMAPAFIVSTSYEHYLRALCEYMEFPYENVFCTKVCLDKYELSHSERQRLIELANEIANMPIMDIPKDAKRLSDLPELYRDIIKRLDEIFWKEIAKMSIGKIFNDVNPMGGKEKAIAIMQICEKLNINLDNVVYVGDSITDVEALTLVRDGGGLAVAFNGNRYAVKNADVAILSETSLAIAVVAELFLRHGKDVTLKVVEKWSEKTLQEGRVVNETLLQKIRTSNIKIAAVKEDNIELLIEESEAFRKIVRGEAVGGLG
ncbi:MAG: HAD hydrolase family protein [Candidatus Bathyarchaeia archaeon]